MVLRIIEDTDGGIALCLFNVYFFGVMEHISTKAVAVENNTLFIGYNKAWH